MRSSEYDIIARNWEYAETEAQRNPLARQSPALRGELPSHSPGGGFDHPLSQTLFLQLELEACNARNVILVCDDDPKTAAALLSTLSKTPPATLTVVCRSGSARRLRKLLQPLAQLSEDCRLRVVEENPAGYLTRLTASSYDALIVSGQAGNYRAALAAASTLLRHRGLLLLTDALANAENPGGGVVVKTDRSVKTVALRKILTGVRRNKDFVSVLLPVGTGVLFGVRR